MRFTITLICTLFFGLLLSAQPEATIVKTYQGPQEDIDAILAGAAQFSAHFLAADHLAMTACYTTDAKIFPNGRDIITGHEDIASYWQPSEEWRTVHHKITPVEITIQGDIAYDHGYYEGATQYLDGRREEWRGKYVIVWHKIDGEWKMYLDIWNGIRSND